MYEDTGVFHPAHLRKPALRGDCIRYLDAYRLLSASRIWTEIGPHPLQTTEVESYLNLAGVNGTQTRMKYVRIIRAMDDTEMQYLLSKKK